MMMMIIIIIIIIIFLLLLILLLLLLLLLLLFLLLLLLLLALQSSVNLSLYHKCPPLFSILLLTSPVPHAHIPQLTRATSI